MAGATVLYISVMAGKLTELVISGVDIDYLIFILGMAVAQIALFAAVMFVITVAVAMPIYLSLVYFGKDNKLSVNLIGLVIGVVVGSLIYSANEYGSLFVVLMCGISGVVTSYMFYVIVKPSNKSLQPTAYSGG